MLTTELAGLPVLQRSWYKFKEGLRLYLTALSEMKERQGGGDRFSQQEKLIITTFIGTVTQTPNLSGRLRAVLTADLGQLSAVAALWEDTDLVYLIKVWVALAAVEDGYQWQFRDPNNDRLTPI